MIIRSEYKNAHLTDSKTTLLSQDFEELLDQKDRLIKKLQRQIKSLETSQKGSVVTYIEKKKRSV